MSLEEYLATESKMERFTVVCEKLRRVDALEKRKSDGAVIAKSRFCGEGKFQRSWTDNSVVIEDIGAELTTLKLSVDLHFLPSAGMVEHKSFGLLSFNKALSTDDGVVDEPDQLILTLFFPEELLTRIASGEAGLRIAIRVGDLVQLESGAMPGLSKKVWKDADGHYLHVRECTVLDPVPESDGDTAPELTREAVQENRASTIQLDPVLQQRLMLASGLIVILLFLLVLK